ncbi:MAG: SusC/RagA family TonB-linked outer membrane protein [Bacteroidales bacterium]|jgi:TonB-linked SusC/RagA family outer membrane protein|nr:SusC/RagA family TonB-linked outer membrane protein [Bacteroidales bacterium]
MKNKIYQAVKISGSLLFLFLLLLSGSSLHAQVVRISGSVSDEQGRPMAGVVISSVNGKNTGISGFDGQYSLEITDKSAEVRFAYSGYQSQVMMTENGPEMNVTLQRAETYRLDEQVYLGYATRRRGDLTGSAATVSGAELSRSPAASLSQALAGRLPGLYAFETYSEPAHAAVTLRVRGANSIRANTPLVVIDGVPYSHGGSFDYFSAEEVESVTVLKDASAQALYGISGANGVLVITTKRGAQGKLKVHVALGQTFEQIATRPSFVSSGDYVQLRNEAGKNDGLGEYAYFSQPDVEGFVSGADRNLYPNNDWRKINMRDISHMQRVSVGVTGGNSKAAFFSNINVMHQGGLWNTGQTEYDPNNSTLWVNFRTNVDVQLNRYLSTSLKLSGFVNRDKMPGSVSQRGTGGIFSNFYTLPSHVFGPVTPRMVDGATGEVLDEGGGVVVTTTEQYPSYAIINRLGYNVNTNTNVYAQFALNLDMSFLTQGLNLTGDVGYQTNFGNTLFTYQTFANWLRTSDYSELEFTPYGTVVDSPLAYTKGVHFYYNVNFRGAMDYDRHFGKHHVSGLAFASYLNFNTPDAASPALLPYKYVYSGIEAAYGYDNRYLLQLDLGYSGSEQYAGKNRFTAVPAVSAGWIVSNEAFMESTPWLSLLKLRASCGKTANDRSGLGRYVYMDNITLARGGALSNYLGFNVTEGQVANPDIAPEISVKQNYGIDISLFNNIAISVDIFREKMENMVAGGVSSTPAYQGVSLSNFPKVNSGIFENRGFELSADYTKAINSRLSFNVGGWLAHAENRVIYSDEAERSADYAYRKRVDGFAYGQEFGLLVNRHNGNGYFNSRQELDNSALEYEIGTPRVGDLIYYDLNDDGIINEQDEAPLGYGAIPLHVYAFHADLRYGNFDLSVLFQGVADYYTVHSGAGRTEYGYDGIYSEIHRNAWTEERYASGSNITYPALAVKANTNHRNNSFFLEDRSYLRLKNATVGYSLPKAAKAIGAARIRLTLSGENLFTRHRLTTNEYGPEGSYLSLPAYRLYHIGLNVKF